VRSAKILALCLVWAVGTAAPARAEVPQAPEPFGDDSAVIDHTYWPMQAGDVWALSGYGALSGALLLYTAGEPTEVAGVRCLPVRYEQFFHNGYSDSTLCLARDQANSLWQIYADWPPSQELWANLEVGDQWVYLSADVEGAVTSLDARVGPLRNGFGTFTDCLEILKIYGRGIQERSLYAPEVGLIRVAYADGGFERVPLDEPQPGFGAVQFSADSYGAREEAGSFPVTVERTGGSEGVVWVEFEVTGGKANFVREGEEESYYTPDNKSVYLAPGQTRVIFDVVVLDNNVWNNGIEATIAISAGCILDGCAAVGEPRTATVHIDEAESGEKPGEFIGPCFIELLHRR